MDRQSKKSRTLLGTLVSLTVAMAVLVSCSQKATDEDHAASPEDSLTEEEPAEPTESTESPPQPDEPSEPEESEERVERIDPDDPEDLINHVVNEIDFPVVEPPSDLLEADKATINEGDFTGLFEAEVKDGALVEAGQNEVQMEYARKSWQHFRKLFPPSVWDQVGAFVLFPADFPSITFPEGYQTGDFLLNSTYQIGGMADFIRIHEVGHVISLDNTNINYGPEGFDRPIGVTNECPTGNTYNGGCARAGSLFANWSQEFWPEEFASEALPNAQTTDLFAFYDKYSDHFWSSYSATNSSEDFAETFATFVYWDHPTLEDGVADGDATIKEKKIAWFFANEEMVKLRNHIVPNLEPIAQRPELQSG